MKKTPLTPQQLEAVDLLYSGMSKLETAKKLGVTPRTVRRWSNENELFRQTMNLRHLTNTSDTLNTLKPVVDLAIEFFRTLMNDDMAKMSDRLAAAKEVIRYYSENQDRALNLEAQRAISFLEENKEESQNPAIEATAEEVDE